MKNIWLYLCILPLYAVVTCETGETCHVPDQDPAKIVKALKDGPVVYLQDVDGKLYSYSADENNQLMRTKIFRLPVIESVYNWFFPNSLELSRNPCEPASWAISRTVYENPNCVTISLFEMVNVYPIELRNRDPWLYPGFSYMHQGPQGMVGVDLTALDLWVAISGYTPEKQKVFGYRKLNYDLAGHNPFMTYALPNGTWKPNKFFKWVAKKIGISQQVIHLPLPDWQIVNLPENAQSNILLKREPLLEGKVILTIPLEGGKESIYFDVERKQYIPIATSFHSFRPQAWPIPEIQQFILALCPKLSRPATLNGIPGIIQLLSREPLYGTFRSNNGITTDVYAALRGPLDFLCNRIRFFDSCGCLVQLKF